MKKSSASISLFFLAFVFYIVSGTMLYKGYDKMTNYYYSEQYTYLSENAYVGGDAYNYIINGNYATGFFVLSMGFLLTGTICLGTGLLIRAMPENANGTKTGVKGKAFAEIDEELPEL